MDGLSAHISGLTHLHVPEEQHYTKVTCEPTSEEGGRESASRHYLMVTMDLNADYCWSRWPCLFSMIRTEGPEALVVMG